MNHCLLTSVFIRLRSGLKVRAKTILGNDDDADDALQEAFCRLWASKADIEDVSHAEGAVVTVVKNVSIDMYRHNAKHPKEDVDSLSTIAEASSDRAELMERYDAVNSMINEVLSERDREILNKREMYGYDFDELAEQYGTTPENIRAIVSRARKVIRNKYRNRS